MDVRKPLLKVILLGNSCVGKTSLMLRFIDNTFMNSYRGTIGADFYTKDVVVDNKIVQLQIWDTVGQERYQSLGVSFYRGADCVALVYDVTSPTSYYSLQVWKEEYLIYGAPKEPQKFPFVVLANKIDLGSKISHREKIQDIFSCDYEVPCFETSAKNNTNVEKAFSVMAKMALHREKEDIMFNPMPEIMNRSLENRRNESCHC